MGKLTAHTTWTITGILIFVFLAVAFNSDQVDELVPNVCDQEGMMLLRNTTQWTCVNHSLFNQSGGGGGNPFNQWLNTTNNVEFQDVSLRDDLLMEDQFSEILWSSPSLGFSFDESKIRYQLSGNLEFYSLYVDFADNEFETIAELEPQYNRFRVSGQNFNSFESDICTGSSCATVTEMLDDNPEPSDVEWTDLTDEGTFTDTKYCTYDSGNSRINCDSEGGSSSFWWNNSGEITQNDTTVFNDNIGLKGTQNPQYAITYDQDGGDSRIISIDYNKSGALVSPFYYAVTVPNDAAASNVIMTVAQQYLDSESDRANTDNVYGQYNNLGSKSPTFTQGTKYFIVDRTINGYDYPFGGVNPGGNLYFGTSWSTVANSVNFGVTSTGTTYNFHDWAVYGTKANNPFGGSRTYQTWGYRAQNFEGCATYDDCYGYWSDNSNNLIDSSLWNETGGTTGLHNNPHVEVWNTTENGYTLTISSLNTWYNFTGLNFGEYDDFTTSGNGMINTYSGTYKVDYAVSFSGSGGSTHAISVLINGEEHAPCRVYRKLGTAGDVGNAGGTCLITLSAGDNVTGAVMDILTPAQNIDIWSVNANLVRVNE